MELSGSDGTGAAKRPRLSSADAVTGEVRLSALPSDVLILMLLRLSTRAAAQTSILSYCWRRIWALLWELDFGSATNPHQMGPAIQAHEAALRRLFVETRDAPANHVVAWLPVAARRLSGCLFLHNLERERSDEDEVPQRGTFELHFLVSLNLGFLSACRPPASSLGSPSCACLLSSSIPRGCSVTPFPGHNVRGYCSDRDHQNATAFPSDSVIGNLDAFTDEWIAGLFGLSIQ